jgi:hypothetical protein
MGVFLLVAAQAQATIAYNYAGGLVGNQDNGPFALGMLFDVGASPIEVDQLGAFDSGANGFGGDVSVAIYSVTLSGNNIASGALVVNPITFSILDPGTLLSGTTTRLQDIPAIQLSSGTYMVVANNYGSGGAEVNYNHGYTPLAPNPNSVNTSGGMLTFSGNYYVSPTVPSWTPSLPGAWTYDVGGDPGPGTTLIPRYAAGNFDYNVIPEPAQFVITAIGLLVLYLGRLRRK